jgi:glutamine synthetase
MKKLLPKSLETALEELEKDKTWADNALGPEYVEWFLALKRAEMKTVSEMESKQRRLHMLNFF